MTTFEIRDPNFEARVRDLFAKQAVMGMMGATLTHVAPGEVEITLPYRGDLTQQNGFLHAGIVTAIADSACGVAAGTLMPPTADVLSVEFKINLLSPAIGDSFRAFGIVLKPGRTITVCRGDVFALKSGSEKLVATMLATMITRKQG